MGEIVNLRTARKRKAHADKEQDAAENRARFGRTRDARVVERLGKELETRKLDAHKRASNAPDAPDDEPEGGHNA
jgi:hypothetical protein